MKSFLAKILLLVGGIGLLAGICMTAVGALGKWSDWGMGNDSLFIPGVIILVVALIVCNVAGKARDKAKASKLSKCKKCGKSLAGCSCTWEYDLSKQKKYLNNYYLYVNITVTCPHCGHKRTIYSEKFENFYTDLSYEEQRKKFDEDISHFIEKYISVDCE